MSGIQEGEKLLDPFCGTGGILLEAALTGRKACGSDIDPEMVMGSRMNLDYFGVEGELKRCDAQDLSSCWDEKFDAVVTDPPYGRASKVGAEEVESMYRESLPEIEKVLKQGKRCVIGAPKQLGLEELLGETDFKVQEKFTEKVHGSLRRGIFVLKK